LKSKSYLPTGIQFSKLSSRTRQIVGFGVSFLSEFLYEGGGRR
jgi:hypothetical protein